MDERDENSIREVVNLIVCTLSYPGAVVFENESKDNRQDCKPASNKNLMKLIGPDFKFTLFEDGL